MTKSFFDAFPTVTPEDENLSSLLEHTTVTKVAVNEKNAQLRVYLDADRLINRKDIEKVEKSIDEAVALGHGLTTTIIERFHLSGQYTSKNLMRIYRSSILHDLYGYQKCIYTMFKNADIQFSDDDTCIVTVDDSLVSKNYADELKRVLDKIFTERFGLNFKCTIHFRKADLADEFARLQHEQYNRVKAVSSAINSLSNTSAESDVVGAAGYALPAGNNGSADAAQNPSMEGSMNMPGGNLEGNPSSGPGSHTIQGQGGSGQNGSGQGAAQNGSGQDAAQNGSGQSSAQNASGQSAARNGSGQGTASQNGSGQSAAASNGPGRNTSAQGSSSQGMAARGKKAGKGRYSKRTKGGSFEKELRMSDNPDVVFGRDFSDEPTAISSITDAIGQITIRGEVLSLDTRDIHTKAGRDLTLVMMNVSDYTDTMTVKLFIEAHQAPEFMTLVKKGMFLKIRGSVSVDRFDSDLTLGSVTGMKKIADFTPHRFDNAPRKRVELHCHTKMSKMDAVGDVKEIVKTAMKWGHSAIAITDHGGVQALPDAWHAVPGDSDFKVIYGCEAYLVDDEIRSVVNGKEGQSFDGTFVVFDLETTGFSPVTDRIIEIGAVKVDHGEIVDHFSVFVNPQRPIPFRIEQLTSINDSMVMDADPIEKVLPDFLKFCGVAVMVGHNVSFGFSFIEENG